MLSVAWADLKSFADNRNTNIHYVELTDYYILIVFDGPFHLTTTVSKLAPSSELTDFEDNYKASGNTQLGDSTGTIGAGSTTQGNTALGHDGTNARILKTDSSGELQIDILTLPALVASTAAIGKLAANSGVTIGAIEFAASQIAGSKEVPDATSTFAPANATSTAYETNRVAKNSAGVLYSITGYNARTTPQFIQLHNTTSLPADTAVPVIIFLVSGSSNFSFSCDKFGRYFSTGITVCNSTTGPTKTIGAADCWFDIQYT